MTDTFGAAFGRLIKRKRAEMRMTQAQLACALYPNLSAEEAEKRKGDISKLENGKVSNPTTQTIKRLADALDISDDELDALERRVQMSASDQLDNVSALDRDQLELLAGRFDIEKPHTLSDATLRDLLTQKAEEYRALKTEVDNIDDGMQRLSNLKAAALGATDRVDLEEVEELLSRVQEVELEEAAKTAELRADNALLRGKAEQAFEILSTAADSFAAVDAVEPARRRISYGNRLYVQGRRYGGLGAALSGAMLRKAIDDLDESVQARLWASAQNSLGVVLNHQGRCTSGEAGTTLLKDAVTAYRAALTIRAEADHSAAWARTQGNLGVALKDQSIGTAGVAGTALLTDSVTACHAAFTKFTKADHPVDWAKTQTNLAIAEISIANHEATTDPRPHLEAALAHVDTTVTFFDPDHMGKDRARAIRRRERILYRLENLT